VIFNKLFSYFDFFQRIMLDLAAEFRWAKVFEILIMEV